MKTVRTRFAPSPTGLLHVGGIRTALFAWLLARQNNGQFILRLEDTDQKREVDGADQHIVDCFKALGLEYDEGPDNGGPLGPYRQSERLDIYKTWANKLIDSNRAYADPYTPEEVQEFREAAQAAKKPFQYRNHRPENPPVWDGTQPLRFRSSPDSLAEFLKANPVTDEVMGELAISPESTDDFVLMKTDGFPTYNFAHIVDDAEMKVSHVIRAQEFLSSMPGYIDLYVALGLDLPKFAHMPYILAEQGNKKLSKRDGAKDLLDYIREGYPPEALVNFIATMGWNDGTEQEIFSMAELIEKFSLDRVQKSGARFDEKRLLWTSGAHIRGMQLDALYENVAGFWPEEAKEYSDDHKKSILALTQERLKHYSELPELTRFFFTDLPINPELISTNKKLKKLSSDELISLLTSALGSLVESDFTAVDLQSRLNTLLETTGAKPAILFSLIRIATTQAPASPSLAESMEIIGKEKTLARINTQLQNL
jgi:glutamyl-tRNA synthetase